MDVGVVDDSLLFGIDLLLFVALARALAHPPALGKDRAVMEAGTCALAAACVAQGEEELMIGGDNAATRLSIYGTIGGTRALTNSLWLCIEEVVCQKFWYLYLV
jgi:hypothetical protein